MTQYTPEDLLRYLYRQTTSAESTAIQAELDHNWALNEKFKVLKSSHRILDGAIESPRAEVITRILAYAKKTMVESV